MPARRAVAEGANTIALSPGMTPDAQFVTDQDDVAAVFMLGADDDEARNARASATVFFATGADDSSLRLMTPPLEAGAVHAGKRLIRVDSSVWRQDRLRSRFDEAIASGAGPLTSAYIAVRVDARDGRRWYVVRVGPPFPEQHAK